MKYDESFTNKKSVLDVFAILRKAVEETNDKETFVYFFTYLWGQTEEHAELLFNKKREEFLMWNKTK